MIRGSLAALVLAVLAGCAGAPVGSGPPPLPPREAGAPARRAATLEDATRQARARLEALRSAPARAPGSGELIRRYEALLSRPGTPEARKPEILLRLAELAYREEAAALQRAYAGEEPVPPGERYRRSVGCYERLVEAYPGSPQALTAYYNLGYLYGERGEWGRSAEAYRQVLARDPATPYADEIHMRLGEAAFDAGDLEEAAAHYRAVAEGGKPEYRASALYKLGWCYFNLERYPEAVEAFHRVLAGDGGSAEDLRRETLEVMAKTLLDWGGLRALQGYLEAHPEVRAQGPALHLLLGDLFLESSRYPEAVEAYVAGVGAYPASAECLAMERGIMAAYRVLRDVEGAMERRESWPARYGPGSPWDRAHGSGPLGAERDALVEEGLRQAALYRHSRAQRGQGELERALGLYRTYLEWFGDRTEAGYEVAYRYAGALREAGRLREAADAYRRVAEHPSLAGHREDAGYRRIQVLARMARDDPSLLDELVAAHEDYVRLNPGSPEVPRVLLDEGDRLLEAGRVEEALGVYRRLVAGYPGTPEAVRAAGRVARCLFRLGAYAEAEAAARRSLAQGPPRDEAPALRDLVVYSVFKQGEALETRGLRAEANRHFLRLVEEFPRSDAARIALYRAAQNLRALGRDREAARLLERLARLHRGTDHARQALILSSRIHRGLGDWEGVARDLEELYRMDPRARGAPDLLMEAALARERAGDRAGAARLLGAFAREFPEDPRVAGALYRQGLALEGLGRPGEAEDRYLGAWEAGGDEAGHARARAALALAGLRLRAFRRVELRGDLAERLREKERLLDEALGWLTRAAGLPYADVLTEALYRAGEAFEHMKEAILRSERPPGLSPEELREYEFLLEERAFPLEERAVGFYRRGVEAARRWAVYDPWVARMYARLEDLVPWAYRRPEEPAVVSEVPDLPAPGGGGG